MKNMFRLVPIIFLFLFLTQCKNKVENSHEISVPKITKITGQVHNRHVQPNTKEVRLIIPNLYSHSRGLQFEYDAFQMKSPIADDGTFYFEFELAYPQNITMVIYLDYLFIRPGDSLHVELDFSRPRTVKFSGDESVADINNGFSKYFYSTGYISQIYGAVLSKHSHDNCTCSWNEIQSELDEDRKNHHERRQAFLKENNVREEVSFLTEAMIELNYYSRLATLFGEQSRLNKETMNPKALLDEMDNIAPKYFTGEMYTEAHYLFVEKYRQIAELVRPLNQETDDFAEWTKKATPQGNFRDIMLTLEAGKALREKDLERFENISTHINSDYFHGRIMHEHRLVLDYLNNPEPVSMAILGNSKEFSGFSSIHENPISKIIQPNLGTVQMIIIGRAGHCFDPADYKTFMNEFGENEVTLSFINFGVPQEFEGIRSQFKSVFTDKTSVHFLTQDEWYWLGKTLGGLNFNPYGFLINRDGVIVDHGTHVGRERNRKEKINLLLEQDKLIKP
jgi:hypothetical protein